MIYETIREDLKKSMLARDTMKTTVLRGIVASLTNEALAKNKKTDSFPDEDVNTIVRRLAKQRKDSIEQFKAGGRKDLVKNEEAELKILEVYLPKIMNEKDIRKIAEAKKKELGISDKKDSVKLIGVLMKELKGKADGSDVKAVIDSLFS